MRGFTVLLLARYFVADLVDKGMAHQEDALSVSLRMEQLGASVRYEQHGVEGEIRGIERRPGIVAATVRRPSGALESGRDDGPVACTSARTP